MTYVYALIVLKSNLTERTAVQNLLVSWMTARQCSSFNRSPGTGRTILSYFDSTADDAQVTSNITQLMCLYGTGTGACIAQLQIVICFGELFATAEICVFKLN